MAGPIKHAHSVRGRVSATYRCWAAMIQRCENPNDASRANYGGRGIKVSKAWKRFENFLADMGNKPFGMTLERKDTNAGYSKKNCKWASRKDQARNRRNNTRLTCSGVTKTLAEWSEEFGVGSGRIVSRIRNGWTNEAAIMTKTNRKFANKRFNV